MTYSLDNFCADTRAILKGHDDREGRNQIRQNLELLLQDSTFLATYTGADSEPGVEQIYQDPNLGFCVLAYNMTQPRTSPPHDHGDSWAVYGQAEGHTDMTIWSAEGGNVQPVHEFRLEAGQAGLFDIREIHSISYAAGAKFVRITGVDMNQETRRVYDPDTGGVREIEAVGTGNRR